MGKRFRIAHLTSERGRTLNGKICMVRDYDKTTTEARLHCEVEKEEDEEEGGTNKKPTAVKLKAINLQPLGAIALKDFMAGDRSKEGTDSDLFVLNSDLAVGLERAITNFNSGSSPLFDYRIGMYHSLLTKLQKKEYLTDQDFCIPCGLNTFGHRDLVPGFCDPNNDWSVVMNACSPACIGDAVFDLRRVDLGLKGDNFTKCGICDEVMKACEKDTTVLVTLPCFHVFHSQCLGNDIRQCPTCNADLPDDLSSYRAPYEVELQLCLDMFLKLGSCTKCQIWDKRKGMGNRD